MKVAVIKYLELSLILLVLSSCKLSESRKSNTHKNYAACVKNTLNTIAEFSKTQSGREHIDLRLLTDLDRSPCPEDFRNAYAVLIEKTKHISLIRHAMETAEENPADPIVREALETLRKTAPVEQEGIVKMLSAELDTSKPEVEKHFGKMLTIAAKYIDISEYE